MRVRQTIAALFGLALAVVAVASLLPLAETNVWWVRFFDFPRMQFALLIVVFAAGFVALGGITRRGPSRWAGFAALALGFAALWYHGTKLAPFTPLAATMDAGGATCGPDEALRILIVNVRRENREADRIMALADTYAPDLFLVMETNGWWDERLNVLDATYPNRLQDIPDDATYYGMHLFSSLPLDNQEIRHPFNGVTPLLVTDVMHPAGRLRFYGIHPRPPLTFGRPSTLRDGVVLEAALEAGAAEMPTILAGDFNATPWERTVRRAMRLGGLLDPRAGRAPMVSYDAQSWILRWPLDQILWQPGLSLVDFTVLPSVGSDHYPVMADLCVGGGTEQRTIPPRDDDRAEAMASLEAARAREVEGEDED